MTVHNMRNKKVHIWDSQEYDGVYLGFNSNNRKIKK